MTAKQLVDKMLSRISHVGLVLLVPVLVKLENIPHTSKKITVMKGEVKSELKSRRLYSKFQNNQIYCSGCGSHVNFGNLGLVKTNQADIKLYCHEPGCTLKA